MKLLLTADCIRTGIKLQQANASAFGDIPSSNSFLTTGRPSGFQHSNNSSKGAETCDIAAYRTPRTSLS